MIAIFVKLSQKKGEIFLPRDKLYFKDIIKTRFNVSDLSIIDELFKLDIKDIEPLIFLEEMYEIFPKELSETIRELTKLDVKSDILDSDLVKELRLKLTKLKQKEIK
jgi:tyrosine-protein phosphatase YwqE